MGLNYVVTTNLAGWRHTLPSTLESFKAAAAAVDRLDACLAIEEAFAILLANYITFEEAVASANIASMVDRAGSITDLHNRRREVDRHLINVLAAGEMFSGHACRRTTKQFRKSGEVQLLEDALQQQRDRFVGFWATECLRNAVLHNALPITSWTTGGRWVGLELHEGRLAKLSPTARLEHSVTFALSLDLLALDRSVNVAMIERLRDEHADKQGHVSWVVIIREYVEGLSMVLGEVRKFWAEVESSASALLMEMADSYRASVPEGVKQPSYVLAVERDDDGRWLRDVLLGDGIEMQLAELRRQQGPMVNLHRRSLAG